MKFPGESFLHQRDPKLHTSEAVGHEQKRKKRRGEKTAQKPAEKLSDWMEVLERTHGHDDPRVLERLKRAYHKQYVIKEGDVPESYFKLQQRLARERGQGDIEITDEMRDQLIEVLRADQTSSLDTWINYLTSHDANAYPTWAKYWAFTGMIRLSAFDKEKHAFGKRTKETVAPFPDLNREALAYVTDAVEKKAKGEKVEAAMDDPDFQKLLKGSNFGKLYAHAIEKVTPAEESELRITEGQWVTYPRGSDHMPLVESLQGHGTGWCTAGELTAKTQLATGDFHAYYSNDRKGNPKIPRIAIRMEDDAIAEVRGIAADQNMDPIIGETSILQDKLNEFGAEGEQYEKKDADMKRLTDIDNRAKAGKELTDEDLRFLYEIDAPIQGFGYEEDPRIKELLDLRNPKKDLAEVLNCTENEISVTPDEAMSGNIKYHYGGLYLYDLTSAEGLTLPESVGGDLYLYELRSAEGLTLPKSVGGGLDLGSLTSAEGLTLPESVGGDLSLKDLTSAEGLTLPKSVGGTLDLRSLTSAEGLTLPESVGGGLYLYDLTSAKGLTLPESVGGYLYLENLTSAKGLTLPKSVGGGLSLSNLTSAKGLTLPESVGGDLSLSNLTSAEGLTLPESMGGGLNLASLTSAEGLTLPKSVGGGLSLSNLTSAKGLTLPKSMGGYLDLRGLTSAKDLALPKSVGGGLDLARLTSAEGLTLPESMGGGLNLASLTSAEGLTLPKSVGGGLYLRGIPESEKAELRKLHPYLDIQ